MKQSGKVFHMIVLTFACAALAAHGDATEVVPAPPGVDGEHRVVAVPIAEGVEIEMVEATNGFFIGKYEVTQEQWKAMMKTSPFNLIGARRPAEHVPWHDAQEFIRRVNALDGTRDAGLRFRLPTEDEWELCCRAGSTNDLGILASGEEPALKDVAWYRATSDQATHEVGTLKPNAWGIYDMFGNVLEMCDTFVFGGYIIKGGGWFSPATSCRASYRFPMFTYVHHDDLGFRLAADMQMENGKPKMENAGGRGK